MRNLTIFFIALCVQLFISACAVMDISQTQTAVPQGTKHVEASLYVGPGINLYPTRDFSEIYDEIAASDTLDYFFDFHVQEEWIYWGSHSNATIAGANINLGVGPKTDVILRSFGYYYGLGYKLGVKQLVWNNDKYYVAVMPLLNYSSGKNYATRSYQGETVFDAHDADRIMGYELHAIFTQKANQNVWFTLSPHISKSLFTRDYNGKSYGPYYVNHRGVQSNVRFNIGHFFITADLGFENFRLNTGKQAVVPNMSMALGLKL